MNIFSQDDILKTMKSLEELKDKFSNNESYDNILEFAKNEVVKEVSGYAPSHTGQIFTSKSGNIMKVYTNDPVLIFQEYGTGIIGSRNSHPLAVLSGWKYDINAHGESGWLYKDNSDSWRWTKGLTAKMGFYNARDNVKGKLKDEFRVKMNDIIGKIY